MYKSTGNILSKWALHIGIAVFIVWVAVGVFLFFYLEPYNYEWSRGEVGDFLNGLGGLALILVGPTAVWQYMQLKEQQKQSYEEGVLRIFETLKPELENLSIRIYAKAIGVKSFALPGHEGENFETLRERFWNFDRTVFLRQLQKPAIISAVEDRIKSNDEELGDALIRFMEMMGFLSNYIATTDQHVESDFKAALKATEVFQTYSILIESKEIKTLSQKIRALNTEVKQGSVR